MSSNVLVPRQRDTTITGFARGQERFGFLYVVVLLVTAGSAMPFRLVHHVGSTETVLALIGSLVFAWSVPFSIPEIRRLARTLQEQPKKILVERNNTCGVITVQPLKAHLSSGRHNAI